MKKEGSLHPQRLSANVWYYEPGIRERRTLHMFVYTSMGETFEFHLPFRKLIASLKRCGAIR